MDLPQFKATHKKGRLCGRCDYPVFDDNKSGLCRKCLNQIRKDVSSDWSGEKRMEIERVLNENN